MQPTDGGLHGQSLDSASSEGTGFELQMCPGGPELGQKGRSRLNIKDSSQVMTEGTVTHEGAMIVMDDDAPRRSPVTQHVSIPMSRATHLGPSPATTLLSDSESLNVTCFIMYKREVIISISIKMEKNWQSMEARHGGAHVLSQCSERPRQEDWKYELAWET